MKNEMKIIIYENNNENNENNNVNKI